MNSKITVGNPQKSEISFLTSILLSHRHFISACDNADKSDIHMQAFTLLVLSLRAVRALPYLLFAWMGRWILAPSSGDLSCMCIEENSSGSSLSAIRQ